jgi:sodium/hydrogen exchanger 10/11
MSHDQVLFQTAGIVVLTLIVNGTTTKKLLDLLDLTAVTQGRIEEMQSALKHVMDQQKRAVVMMKHDRFLQDANWDYIHTFTRIENPYREVITRRYSKKLKKLCIREFAIYLSFMLE